jgi:hypothetical protein
MAEWYNEKRQKLEVRSEKTEEQKYGEISDIP